MSLTWMPLHELPAVGAVVRLRFADGVGSYGGSGRYFAHDNGRWYQINPPTLICASVTAWAYDDDDQSLPDNVRD